MLTSFFKKLCPKDCIAVIVLACGFFLIYKGIDHVVSGATIAVVTYYFVKPTTNDNTKVNQSS